VLSNANKYCENGTITIAGEVQDGKVLIKIIDTGKGMSNENQKLLFHKFQQAGADILTRDNTKGTGLGLYISRLLATNMHGNVVLERSEEGKGSCFVISLQSAHEQ
jgi:signal transduction histidine kinase